MKFFCGLDVNRSGNVFIEMQSFKMTVFEQPLTDESIQSFGFFFLFYFQIIPVKCPKNSWRPSCNMLRWMFTLGVRKAKIIDFS